MAASQLLRRAGIASLVVVFFAFQAYAVWSGRIPRNSDQSIVGLMARHILAGKGHPVFYYGATYDGSVEPHYVAGVFAVFGSSFATYRLGMALLLDLIVIALVTLTWRTFGERAGLAALAYLAVPPFFLLYKGLTSDGAYDAFLLAAVLSIGLALAADRRIKSGVAAVVPLILLGVAVGVGWWVTPLSAMVTAPVLLWLILSPRPRPGVRDAVATAVGAAVGAFPWWFWNAKHHWASLKAAEMGTAGIRGFVANEMAVIWTSLPTLEGGILSSPDYRQVHETFLLSRPIALIALAVLLVPTLVAALRGDRRKVLFGVVLAAVCVAAACSGRLVATEPRFLFAYYAVSAPLIGLAAAEPSSGRWRRLVNLAALGILLVLHGASVFGARDSPVVSNDKEVTGSLDLLRKTLETSGLRRVYANYWTAYRLSFESDERIIATPLPGDEAVRYLPYREQVDASPNPGVVLLSERDACYRAYLRERSVAFRRRSIGEFGVYSDLPPVALASLRAGLGLPLPSIAYRVGWNVGPQPSSLLPGESKRMRVDVTNRGPCVWPALVHLGYHWWPLDSGLPAIYDGPRGFLLDVVRPGDSASVPIDLRAPERPGRYRLQYDLVHEGVVWFSDRGGQTANVEVRVGRPQARGGVD